MKTAILPRFLSAVASVVVTVFLFDLVATMGRSPDSEIVSSTSTQPAVYYVAAFSS